MKKFVKVCKEWVNSLSSPAFSVPKTAIKPHPAGLSFLLVLLGLTSWKSYATCEQNFDPSPQNIEILAHELMPLAKDTGDESFEVYRQNLHSQDLRFLILKNQLALLISPNLFKTAQTNPEVHKSLIKEFSPDLVKIWFDDAMHWLTWLKCWDEQFGGSF